MKRRKILVLIPMLGLFLTGCSFQEGFATAKHWIGQNIYHPLKDWIDEMTGKKSDEKKEDEKKEEEGETVAVTGVSVNPTSLTFTVGDADKTVTATVAPENATEKGVTWSTSNEGVATVTEAGVVHAVAKGTATITATSKGDATKSATCSVTVNDQTPGPGPTGDPGTEGNPYTVEQAINAIDNGGTVENVYATGFVSGIVTAYSSQNQNVSFNISSDGLTNSPQLEGYRTKGTTDYPIDSAESVQVGDKVTLYGSLVKYNSTYEFAQGNTLVFQERKAQDPIAVRITSGSEVAINTTLELVAQVGPASASQSVTWSIVEGSSLATLEGNVLTAGGTAGDVKVRATATGFENVYAEAVVSVVASAKAYRIVTDPTTLADGDSIMIASEDSALAMGAYTGGNNVPAKAITTSEGVVTSQGDAVTLTLEEATGGNFYIKIGEQYLYAASSSGNQLKAKDDKDDANGVWQFSYADGKMSIIAYGSSNRNNMRANVGNNPPMFSCYAATSSITTLMQVYRLS